MTDIPEEDMTPLDKLGPDTDLHTKVLQVLLDKLEFSERKMTNFYPRWRLQEMRMQAFINLEKMEQELKEISDNGEKPQAVSLVIPYSYATIATIVTYMVHAFTGRKPMFQVGATAGGGSVEAATNMEHLLQYNVDTNNLVRKLIYFLKSSETYGVGVARVLWREKYGKRRTKASLLNTTASTWERKVVWEGNDTEIIDPFLFFPDPRVPMSEVAQKGEFVFWRSFRSKHELMSGEANGQLNHTDYCGALPPDSHNESIRGIRVGSTTRDLRGENFASGSVESFVQVDQGTVSIIPSELGLGDSNVPEKWLFSIANKRQIIQAEPFDYFHEEHPIVVAEPHSDGLGFGHMSTADFLSPLQDAMSWFLNSHMHNVRASLNNMFVVNPQMVNVKDFKNPKPGKLITMRRSGINADPRRAVHQLNVGNATAGHIGEIQNLMRLGDTLSAVTDNLRGIQSPGGRRSATEARISGEAAASRLAMQTKLVSAQAIAPLASQMSINWQQFMSMELALPIIGQDGIRELSAESVDGNFFYPIHDGTLPMDKVALLDTWKEVLLMVSQDQQLRSGYSVPRIFEFVAELGGAQNVQSFKLDPQPDATVEAALEDESLIPATPGGDFDQPQLA